ncbi:DUF3099 domain-containing protein [Actinoplanes regularis]|uniref:DUF3099 domain-containing protein n=1 Tax=Actinoplanes regularis TaxID=52697 RepID=A0A238UXB3_9ACTN|nr:DUF3099 domain-containing protein [Actinoplanes regularis]GIE84257.1 hypothetical protein Are01nite_07370 [Actinoplanes regularis]SNR26855.1 Protein of unknown function [Actinoplanes regularis]
MKKQPPVVITSAARSPSDQLRSREIRYVTMMSVRAGCLILGGVLVSVRPPLLPVWLTLCAIAMVLLPWMAVLIANDGPPKTKAERLADAAAREQRQMALAEPSAEPTPEPVTIDSDIVDPDVAGPDEEHRRP